MITNYIISYFESNCIKNIVQFRSPITKYCSIYRNLSLFFKKIQFYPTKKRKSLPLSASLSANACPCNERSLPYRGRERSVRLCAAERWCERTVEDACPYRGLDDSRSFVRRRRMVRTMKRTARQLVARTPCPYRGLDDFRLFVRRRRGELSAVWGI